MANTKISDLRASAPAGALTGAEAVELVQGGVSKGGIISQIPTYLNSLANFLLGNSNITITNAGRIGGAFWFILSDGSASFASGGLLTIGDTGVLTINAGAILLNPDGSAAFSFGNTMLNAAGSVDFGVGTGPPTPTSISAAGLITTTAPIEITTAGEGYIMKSPNGTRYKLTVDNAGQLGTAPA